jgi:ankyrin repeat protein
VQRLRELLTTNNVNDVDGIGYTAFYYAVWKGHVNCVKYCVEIHANVNETYYGWTPLHNASVEGHVDVVRILLDAGAMIDTTYNNRFTPLFFAIRNNRSSIAKLLIDRGAKIANVKLDNSLPTIPDWVNKIIASRSMCRDVAVVVIGIHRYHYTNVTGNNDINVLRLVSKHIWSTRMDDAWVAKNDENEG